ncbi:MAG: hypothetical protein HY315_08275 [Acidobacteria bacterium]|nr:hypothetical protein [Acidobacteriota bacterium]
MLTDRPPRNAALLAQFLESDRLAVIELPQQDRLSRLAQSIDLAMKDGTKAVVQQACAEFVEATSEFYQVRKPGIRVLAARPLRVRDGGRATELFGDYAPEEMLIRVWMRTAVRKQVTSFGTFLSTLCHELIHHLDYVQFGFGDSPHTRGFYERTAALYHHARGTAAKRLFWLRVPGGRWRIDWPRTNRSA